MIVPATDAGDKWSRRMENPSHDEVSPTKLRDPKARRTAMKIFQDARRSIRQAIDEEVGTNNYDEESNIEELRSILPDEFDPNRPGNMQLISTEARTPSNRMEEIVEIDDDDELGDDFSLDSENPFDDVGPEPNRIRIHGPQPDNPPSPNPNPVPKEKRGPGYTSQPRVSLNKTRFIAAGETECVVAFELGKSVERMEIVLKPAGVEPGGVEESIVVTSASIDGRELDRTDGGGILIPNPPVGERTNLTITTGETISNQAVVVLANLREATK